MRIAIVNDLRIATEVLRRVVLSQPGYMPLLGPRPAAKRRSANARRTRRTAF